MLVKRAIVGQSISILKCFKMHTTMNILGRAGKDTKHKQFLPMVS